MNLKTLAFLQDIAYQEQEQAFASDEQSHILLFMLI